VWLRVADGLRLPAVRALLLQCLSLVLVLLLARLFWTVLNIKTDLIVAALLQGIFAATGARMLRLAYWWLLIQLLFPLALLLTWFLHLPPLFFLAAFLIFLIVYWSCFRTQVPYYPSRRFAAQAVLQLLPAQRALRVIDIGSGLGGFVLHLARNRPDCELIGIELAPLPWLLSYLRARMAAPTVRFLLGDYQRLDFSRFDVVFAYLSPAAMDGLWRKAQAEMRPGGMLLSYEFIVHGQVPDLTLTDPAGGPLLYGWLF
jgi:SAM-dependent methyltransferase